LLRRAHIQSNDNNPGPAWHLEIPQGLLPYPGSAIPYYTEPDFFLRNQSSISDLQKAFGKFFFILNLMPAYKMNNLIFINQIEPKPLTSLYWPFPRLPFQGDGSGRVGVWAHQLPSSSQAGEICPLTVHLPFLYFILAGTNIHYVKMLGNRLAVSNI